MQPEDLGFIHRFVPAANAEPEVVVLLLHGTGGNEDDLLPLARILMPGTAMLSPRGQVLENGVPRFFRRFAEGVFDVEDLKARTDDLARFIERARSRYGLQKSKFVAVGYSNGANIAASLMFLHPHHLAAGVLFRAMVPFQLDLVRDLSHLSVLIGAGRTDRIVGPDAPEELAGMLAAGGAGVSLFWHKGGHELGQDDVDAAIAWLTERGFRSPDASAKRESA